MHLLPVMIGHQVGRLYNTKGKSVLGLRYHLMTLLSFCIGGSHKSTILKKIPKVLPGSQKEC